MALPGVLTLLSLLAVVLGSHAPAPDPQPRMTAGTVSPTLPELRPAPTPAPGVPLLPAPPPQPYRLTATSAPAAAPLASRCAPRRQPDLNWWGRSQTDGG